MKHHLFLAIASLLLAGCAKFPTSGGGETDTRLIFTFQVDGRLRFGTEEGSAGVPYVYMVALRPSTEDNPTTQGPIPVIAPPWGNGFVAGNCTHFVWWDPTQASPFTVYQFRDTSLQQWYPIGVPVSFDRAEPGATKLRFELSLSQLAPGVGEAALQKSIQVNVLTMDRVPQSGTTKFWDALGDGRLPSDVNQYVTIPLRTSGVYNNARAGNLEPRGDQPNPDLDIVDWSVEVRVQ